MIRPVTEPPPGIPHVSVPDAGATLADVRDGRGDGAWPAAPADPVLRRRAWLLSHPRGVIGRLHSDRLVYAATVDGVELARVYGDSDALMDLVDQAEAEGRCPLHPQTRGPAS